MDIETYLENGGVLTNPSNVPPRYRAELLKLMATFVDSELAGAAGFADTINAGPGTKERIAAAKIVLEKTSHAEKVLGLMGEFGADEQRYVQHHPWTARLPREADIGTQRSEHDMRLSLFNYPLEGWADAVTMNLLMGRAVGVQMRGFEAVSYQPLAEAFREIAPVEKRHAELAREGLERLVKQGQAAQVEASVVYWLPRVAASFSGATGEKLERLRKQGLRLVDGQDERDTWQTEVLAELAEIGLKTSA